jgi:hypothetical protein
VIRQTATPETEIVLGDDWMRPAGGVEAELRSRRARRGWLALFRSPLARRIILFNMLALVLLAAGVLFTNPFRDTLLRQHEQALRTQAEALADVLATIAGPARLQALAALRLPAGPRRCSSTMRAVAFRHAGAEAAAPTRAAR